VRGFGSGEELMFTGIVRELGRVEAVERNEAGARVRIGCELAAGLTSGDSVAVEGCCLTVAEPRVGAGFEADVINQTLSLTTLGGLEPGSRVNLEPALRAGQPLGGHIVQGHVDGVGEVVELAEDGISRRLRVRLPNGLERYAVEHGSITLAGVSLTVAGLEGDAIEVALIPETLERTTLGALGPGSRLNVELDVVARYVERLLGFKEGKD
jgi:riboflavin synthase